MHKYGLIGKNIDYSFSKNYFSEKFNDEKIEATYENFDCATFKDVSHLLSKKVDCSGFNVTIPYKQSIISLMSEMNKHAEVIGAVNTVKRMPNGRLKGFNTDHIGFIESIKPYLTKDHKSALILGTGGSSKAIAYALERRDISFKYVSRKPTADQLGYQDINGALLAQYTIIINCTPVGTHPNVKEAPKLPYRLINSQHLLYDLVYNPAETQFLKNGKEHGAQTVNGLEMLKLQAEAAWRIWN